MSLIASTPREATMTDEERKAISKLRRRQREAWRFTVAQNVRVWLPLAVVNVLDVYINNEKGYAFPKIETIARNLNTDRRNVQRAIKRLVDDGWVVLKRGGGAGKSHRYYMGDGNGGVWNAVLDGKGGVWNAVLEEKGGVWNAVLDAKRAAYGTPEPRRRKRNLGEKRNLGGTRARDPDLSTGKEATGPSRSSTAARSTNHQRFNGAQIPPEWQFGSEEAATAASSLAQWDLERAQVEFIKFHRHHTRNKTPARDWSARWESWCDKGPEYERRPSRSSSSRIEDELDDVVAAANQFVRQGPRPKLN
jgi:hypothetical protein